MENPVDTMKTGVYPGPEGPDVYVKGVIVASYRLDGMNVISGSKSRSILEMMGDVINVKNPPYGAAGDGVTDDTVAINAAYQAAHDAGGGLVFFPPGTYKTTATIGPVEGSPYVETFGCSRASVIAGAGDFDTFVINGGSGGKGSMYGNHVKGLYFDGSGKTGGREFVASQFAQAHFYDLEFAAPYDGMVIDSFNNIVVERIVINEALKVNGSQRILITNKSTLTDSSDCLMMRDIVCAGSSPMDDTVTTDFQCHGIIVDGFCNTVTIQKSYMNTIEGYPYWFRNSIGAANGPGYSTLDKVETDFPAMASIYLQSATGVHIFGCQCEDAFNASGLVIDTDAKGVDIMGGQFNDNGQSGIYIKGSRVSVTGTQIFSNGKVARMPSGSAANNSPGITVDATASDVIITGVLSGPGNTTQNYGVMVNAGANSFIVANCDLTSNTSGGIQDNTTTATSKVIANNLS